MRTARRRGWGEDRTGLPLAHAPNAVCACSLPKAEFGGCWENVFKFFATSSIYRLLSGLCDLLNQCGKGSMLRLVRLGHKKFCSFFLGLLEHFILLLTFCAVKKPKKPCGDIPMERNRGSQLPASTILPAVNEPS